jgi:hypothetical protein
VRRLWVLTVVLAAAAAVLAGHGSGRVAEPGQTPSAGVSTWSRVGTGPGREHETASQGGSGGSGVSDAHPAAARCGWESVPIPPIGEASLIAVAAHSQSDVWIVGRQGEFDEARTLVLHYDGQSVHVVPSPSPFPRSTLYGVVAFGPAEVWAVGEGVSATEPHWHYEPIVLRYDGEGWKQAPVPAVATGFGASLFAVAGASPDDVWAVGESLPDEDGDWEGFIEYWDGREWRIAPSPRGASYYVTVAAVSADDVWAAGNGDDDSGLAAHWDGGRWVLVEDATSPVSNASGVSASDPNNVWIVGWEGAGPFAERFNGEKFAPRRIPYSHFRANYENREDSWLADVEVISRRNIWAVGNFGIEHYNGRRWKKGPLDRLDALAATSATDIWAVGGKKVLHFSCNENSPTPPTSR